MKYVLHPRMPEVHLRTGGLIVTAEPQWIITVLGSCISVTMFCPRMSLAGICHAMLPRPRTPNPDSENVERYRFVSYAIPGMLDMFHRAGIQNNEIEVKMFGGASVLQAGCDVQHDRWVGNANIIAAREVLKETRLKLIAESVGGLRGRKIIFNTQTGAVLHKHLGKAHERI